MSEECHTATLARTAHEQFGSDREADDARALREESYWPVHLASPFCDN
jgi:hypothetical protein